MRCFARTDPLSCLVILFFDSALLEGGTLLYWPYRYVQCRFWSFSSQTGYGFFTLVVELGEFSRRSYLFHH